MLKFRVIPIVLVDGPNVVKGTGFDNWRRIGTLPPALNVYNARDVDELIVLDTRASRSRSEFNDRILAQALNRISVPLSVGGGVTSVDTVSRLIDNGADKVVIGSALSSDPQLLERASSRFGSQALIAAIDVTMGDGREHICHCYGGTERLAGTLVELALLYQSAGAGEILVNSITNDGLMNGFDLTSIASVAEEVDIPVIAAGGAGLPDDFVQLATRTRASAGAAGSMFVFTETTPQDVRRALAAAQIPVRTTRLEY